MPEQYEADIVVTQIQVLQGFAQCTYEFRSLQRGVVPPRIPGKLLNILQDELLNPGVQQ